MWGGAQRHSIACLTPSVTSSPLLLPCPRPPTPLINYHALPPSGVLANRPHTNPTTKCNKSTRFVTHLSIKPVCNALVVLGHEPARSQAKGALRSCSTFCGGYWSTAIRSKVCVLVELLENECMRSIKLCGSAPTHVGHPFTCCQCASLITLSTKCSFAPCAHVMSMHPTPLLLDAPCCCP